MIQEMNRVQEEATLQAFKVQDEETAIQAVFLYSIAYSRLIRAGAMMDEAEALASEADEMIARADAILGKLGAAGEESDAVEAAFSLRYDGIGMLEQERGNKMDKRLEEAEELDALYKEAEELDAIFGEEPEEGEDFPKSQEERREEIVEAFINAYGQEAYDELLKAQDRLNAAMIPLMANLKVAAEAEVNPALMKEIKRANFASYLLEGYGISWKWAIRIATLIPAGLLPTPDVLVVQGDSDSTMMMIFEGGDEEEEA